MEHADAGKPSDLEKILAKLSPKADLSSKPSQIPPAPAPTDSTGLYTQGDKNAELLRLKQELLAANSKIALQEQELAQTRVIKHTLDQALGPPSEADFGGREITEQTISHLQNAFNASNPTFAQFQDTWNGQDDSQSDISDALSTGAYSRARGAWPQYDQQAHEPTFDSACGEPLSGPSNSGQDPLRFWGASTAYPAFASRGALQAQRVLSGPSCGFQARSSGDQVRYLQGPSFGSRRSITQGNRASPAFPAQNTLWSTFSAGSPADQTPQSPTSRPESTYQQLGIYPISAFHPGRVGSPLSPTATEFTSTTSGASWATSSVGVPALRSGVYADTSI